MDFYAVFTFHTYQRFGMRVNTGCYRTSMWNIACDCLGGGKFMKNIKKILVATDGSEYSRAAIEEFSRVFIDPKNTCVCVVSAYEQPVMTAAAPYAMPVRLNENFEKGFSEMARKAASQAESQIRGHFPELQENLTSKVLRGAPEQTIVEEAENWNADLIVVGSHGYNFLERVFLGSVSTAIVNNAPCSVMVVRKKIRQK